MPTVDLSRSRARPLPPDDRRDAILESVLPLIREHGGQVSTRQLAEASGVAEGTLFRAFGDKESLIAAAVERYFEPEPLLRAIRAIDRDLPLEAKLEQALVLLQERMSGVIAMAHALRMHERPVPLADPAEQWLPALAHLLEPDRDRLAVPVAEIGAYVRLVAFGSSFRQFNRHHPFTPQALVALMVSGVAKTGRPTPEDQ